jgi:sugar lactone lactonase YvrE
VQNPLFLNDLLLNRHHPNRQLKTQPVVTREIHMSTKRFARRNILPAMLCALALTNTPDIAAAESVSPASIILPGTRLFPESLTSTSDGTVIIGSVGTGTIFRAAPGTVMAGVWIQPGTDGLQGVFGVFADEASKTLWACSGAFGAAPGSTPPPSALHAFDLTTGVPKGRYPLPTAGAFCNDIAVGADGTAYVSDTNNMEIARLPKGGQALEMWAGNEAFGPKGGVLDGIAVVDGRVLVNTLATSKLFAVTVAPDGSAGTVVEIALDRAIERPDGMRSIGANDLLVVEGGSGGQLSRIALDGDNGKVTTIKSGYPDGPVAVTVVGEKAYVLEGQLAGMRAQPDSNAALRPFQATAVALE